MRRIVAAGLMLMLVVLISPEVGAQTDEGVQVHGHWKIEILDPDGTLVSSYEFDNGFTGGEGLRNLLTSATSAGVWSVMLQVDGAAGTPEPCSDAGNDERCIITDPGNPASGANIFKNLTTSTTPAVILSGNATAANTTTIAIVSTSLGSCPPTVGPSSCTAGVSNTMQFDIFTIAGLATPQAVAPGQIIQVTVTIIFS